MDEIVQTAKLAKSWRLLLVGGIVGTIVGLALGLLIGWVWLPVEWIDAAPVHLRSDFQNEYLLLIAERYANTRDIVWARARLGTDYWDGEEHLIQTLQSLSQEHSGQEAVALQLLVDDLLAPETTRPTGPATQIAKLPAVTYAPESSDTPKATSPPEIANTPTIPLPTPLPTSLPMPSTTPCGPWFTCADYIVSRNDTLYSLAQKTNMTVSDLKLANCLVDDKISVGQHLCLPFIPPVPTIIPAPTNTQQPVTLTPDNVMSGGGALPADWIEEVYFSPGGGGSLGCQACPGGVGPEIRMGGLDCICLRSFPFDQEITVNLYAPNGSVYAGIFQVKTEDGEPVLHRTQPSMTDTSQEAGWAWIEADGITAILIHLWGAASLPPGTWRAEASSADVYAESQDEIADTDFTEPISIVPNAGANPFVAERGSVYTLCIFGPEETCGNRYSPGDWVQISGARLPANTPQLLSVYHRENGTTVPATLFYAKPVTTDITGRFQTSIQIGAVPAGIYWVVFGNPACAGGGGDACLYMGNRGCFAVSP